jgi:hypothetical protein
LRQASDLAALTLEANLLTTGYWVGEVASLQLQAEFTGQAFHENVYDDPFPALQGQKEQITRVLKRMAKHNMYAIIDLHSMPGRTRSVPLRLVQSSS